jgi:hypothetical protein
MKKRMNNRHKDQKIESNEFTQKRTKKPKQK